MANSQTKKKPPNKRERAAQVMREQVTQECLTLRKKGMSHRDIAAALIEAHAEEVPPFTITYKTVGNYLRAALTELVKQRMASTDQLVELELQTLNWLHESQSGAVDAGDSTAASTVLRVSESRRRLLGLDSPAKVEVEGELHHSIVRIPAKTESREEWELQQKAQKSE